MFIASRYHVIKESEEYRISDGMVEKLDEMLSQYGVTHFFTLPRADADGFAADDEVLNICYDDNDDAVFCLVYALWLKTVRNVNDKMIVKGLRHFTDRHNAED